ncbi:hypothetical protein NUU61_004282 [Penicillium alfredii]|uniref:Cytochrome P450 n=1 Tax=Penicillium alfredii TaxID=1506179 RepID=A0A9W9KD43_9EURO|nr:uncharacterized protein NUU61_004282 [Penicillium alfredii]KAJ5102060.1 hypothetical protein NUU61_004282 [Penicillium alfredii]
MGLGLQFISALKLTLGLYIVYKLFGFVRFYIYARRAGFPVYTSPWLSKSIPFLVLAPVLQPLLKHIFPEWVYDRFDILVHGWEFRGGQRLPIMPRALQMLGYQLQKIPEYTHSVLEEERKVMESGSGARNNFLSLLLRLSDEEKRRQSGFSLSDEELSGNLFVFTTAGFETVSNTMGYAVTMLAAHPEYQAWIREELQDLDMDSTTWAYDDVFPKCKRTLAVMLETLRLFSPVHHIMRSTREPQQLLSDRGTHLLLPPMDLFVGVTIIHKDPRYWGPDPEVFRPSRWIDATGQIITPATGTFRPWSGGPRVLPWPQDVRGEVCRYHSHSIPVCKV